MVKRLIKVFLLFIFIISSSNLLGQSQIKKYKILIDLCKSIADVNCELKYYSYLYEIASPELKNKIKNEVNDILSKLSHREKKRIKLEKFRKNWVYFTVKKSIFNENENVNLNNVTIGLCVPLKGVNKSIGINILKGVLAGINFFHSPLDIKIKIFDTSSFSIEDFKSFIENNDLKLIIGPVLNINVEKILQVLKNLEIPVILLSNKLDYAMEGDNIFVHNTNIDDEAKVLCNLFIEDGVKNLAILYPENEYGFNLKSLIFKYCDPAIISAIASYPQNTTDFKYQLFKIGNIIKKKDGEFIHGRDIDAIFIADNVEKALLIIPQIYFFDFKDIKIYGMDLWNTPKLYNLDKKFLKNISFVDCVDYKISKDFNKYIKIFLDAKPNFLLYLGYDTMTIVKHLNFSSYEETINELKSKKFNLLTGLTYFDQYGISHKSYKIFRINFQEKENVWEKRGE